jgi:hypothetical protein
MMHRAMALPDFQPVGGKDRAVQPVMGGLDGI